MSPVYSKQSTYTRYAPNQLHNPDRGCDTNDHFVVFDGKNVNFNVDLGPHIRDPRIKVNKDNNLARLNKPTRVKRLLQLSVSYETFREQVS
jgi:hypothetical protein